MIQLSLFANAPTSDVEAYVQSILAMRRKFNASGQRGEDVENIRATYLRKSALASPGDQPCA